MGLNILVVMFSAAAIISASLLYQRWNTPNPTAPRLADGGFYDCGETYCPLMKTIPAGTFGMGSDDAETSFATRLGDMPEYIQDEKPSHNVAIREFAMSITEVTREQFEAFIKARRYRPEGFCFALLGKGTENPYLARWDNPGHRQQGDHPAVCVTWWDAKAYADFLSRKTGHTYRLPSEAEWEYAARAGTTTSRYWGQSNDEACQYANVWDASGEDELRLGRDRFGRDRVFPCKDGYAFTAPVGKYRPNAFGIYDTLGNVWEWTLDCYNASYSGAPADGSAWLSGECDTRVFRGGSWRNYPWEVRSALRVRDSAVYRFDFVGFRVVRTD